jgi:hypothetical protein
VWVSNGHLNPVFYVAANGAKGVEMWKLPNVGGSWIHITQLDGQFIVPQTPYGARITYGPLYLDPYDPDHLFVLGKAGIMIPVLNTGGHVDDSTTFQVDALLTELLSNSGQYQRGSAYVGGNGLDVVNSTQATFSAKAILSSVAFQRGNSHRVIAASPVTGMFAAIDDKRQWLSLSEYLPKPFTMVSDVRIENDSFAYAVQEGRGILRLFNWDQAKTACYYRLPYGFNGVIGKAQLMGADGAAIAGVQVSVLTVQNGAETSSTQTTDSQGFLPLSGPSSAVLHLSFAGNDNIASCETAVLLP